MSALNELKNKNFAERNHIEKAIVELWEDTAGYEWLAEKAATELAKKDAEIERLRARVEMLEDAISICVQFLTNTNTITDEMQVRLVKCLKDANRLDLADAIAVGGFASIVGEE